MQKRIITLGTICFYLITLIASYLIFGLGLCSMFLIGDEEGFLLVGPLFYIFPALATYGYNTFLIKNMQKLRRTKLTLWLIVVSANTLIPFIAVTVLSRYAEQSLYSYLLELAILTFVAMLPMIVGLAFSFLDLFIKEKASKAVDKKAYRVIKILFYVMVVLVLYVSSVSTLIVVFNSRYLLRFLI